MHRALTVLIVALALFGCVDEELHIECKFDSAITDSCHAEENAKLTCVVEKHPQCPENVCIAWKGTQSVCSKTCVPVEGGNPCPNGSFCATYQVEKRNDDGTISQPLKAFCVPTDAVTQ